MGLEGRGSAVQERMTLDAFLAEAAPGIDRAVAGARGRALAVADGLRAELTGEPAIAAQLDKLGGALPDGIAAAPLPERRAAVRVARHVFADVKARWIDADDPPLVDRIDEILAELDRELAALERPDLPALTEAARRIDALAEGAGDFEDLERRLALPAAGAALLFVLGLVFFFRPDLVSAVSPVDAFWTVMGCLCALPALAVYYTLKARPRTRADAEIDALNRDYFLPNGGIYFPPGARPACVIRVAYTPPPPEPPLTKAPRDPRAARDRRGRAWD